MSLNVASRGRRRIGDYPQIVPTHCMTTVDNPIPRSPLELGACTDRIVLVDAESGAWRGGRSARRTSSRVIHGRESCVDASDQRRGRIRSRTSARSAPMASAALMFDVPRVRSVNRTGTSANR